MSGIATEPPPVGLAPVSDRAVVEFQGVGKHFPGVQAVSGVTLGIAAGEVHAVCGENGAGKSTLMKLLAGLESPDTGSILVDGDPIEGLSPRAVQQRGVAMVHQELALAPDLTVADNLFLGRERRFVVEREAERTSARALLDRVGLEVDVNRRVATLSVAEQQLVEIAKALAVNARVTIMDEPTASLTGGEIERLFGVVERLRSEGIAVLYITHRLEEIFRLADRISVMRDGQLVGTVHRGDVNERDLVRMMVGRAIDNLYPKPAAALGEVVLRATDVTVPGRVRGCSLEVRAGEILGIAGIVGAGRSELVRAIFGAQERGRARVEMHGRPVVIREPRDAIRAGIAYVTEDRKGDGLALGRSIVENITLVALPTRAGVIRRGEERRRALAQRDTLGIRTPSIDRPVQVLSGGNQQKVMLARWLEADAAVLFFDEPARGVDIGAKAEMFQLIGELAENGKAVVMISSYLPELLNMCDRILVMRDGAIVGELPRGDFSEERIVGLATRTEATR